MPFLLFHHAMTKGYEKKYRDASHQLLIWKTKIKRREKLLFWSDRIRLLFLLVKKTCMYVCYRSLCNMTKIISFGVGLVISIVLHMKCNIWSHLTHFIRVVGWLLWQT